MMPLGLLQTDECAEVVEVKNENNFAHGNSLCNTAAIKSQDRAADMGLRAGKIVEVLSNEGSGPILLKIDESRIAMGRGLAMKIMVRRIET